MAIGHLDSWPKIFFVKSCVTCRLDDHTKKNWVSTFHCGEMAFFDKKILNLKYKNDPLPTSMGKCVKGILSSILHEFSYGIEKFSGTQLVLVLAGT